MCAMSVRLYPASAISKPRWISIEFNNRCRVTRLQKKRCMREIKACTFYEMLFAVLANTLHLCPTSTIIIYMSKETYLTEFCLFPRLFIYLMMSHIDNFQPATMRFLHRAKRLKKIEI